MIRQGTDYRDERNGAYEAVNANGKPQPHQVREDVSPHQAAQWGADVRPLPRLRTKMPCLRADTPPEGTVHVEGSDAAACECGELQSDVRRRSSWPNGSALLQVADQGRRSKWRAKTAVRCTREWRDLPPP